MNCLHYTLGHTVPASNNLFFFMEDVHIVFVVKKSLKILDFNVIIIIAYYLLIISVLIVFKIINTFMHLVQWKKYSTFAEDNIQHNRHTTQIVSTISLVCENIVNLVMSHKKNICVFELSMKIM